MILFSLLASLCLICIGILNTNGLTLMVSSTQQWSEMASQTGYYGAVLGTANNFSDPVMWLRLMTMFGLGLITAGIWAAFDAHFLMRSNAPDVPEKYRLWTTTLALLMTFIGAAILTGIEYVVKTGADPAAQTYPALSIAYPFGVVFFSYLTFIILWMARQAVILKTNSARQVAIAAVLQFLTLAFFGVTRQIGQNAGIATFQETNVATLPEAVQWDTLIAFVVIFLLGVGVIVWMVVQCVKCSRKTV